MPHMNDRVYKPLKYGAQIVLPAVATLYLAIATLWGFSHTEQVVGTITAVNTFLGVVLGLSTISYNKASAGFDGTMVVEETSDKKIFSMEDVDPDQIERKDSVTFRVVTK